MKLREAIDLVHNPDFLKDVERGRNPKEAKTVARTIQAAVLRNVRRLEAFEKETGFASYELKKYREFGASTEGTGAGEKYVEKLLRLRGLYGGAQSNVTKVKALLKSSLIDPKDFGKVTMQEISNGWVYAEAVIGSAIWDAIKSEQRQDIVKYIEGETDSANIRERIKKMADELLDYGKVLDTENFTEMPEDEYGVSSTGIIIDGYKYAAASLGTLWDELGQFTRDEIASRIEGRHEGPETNRIIYSIANNRE